MKQGPSSSTVGGVKHEPISHAVTPKAAANIGVCSAKTVEVGSGRGFTAPKPTGGGTHKSGSQGKY